MIAACAGRVMRDAGQLFHPADGAVSQALPAGPRRSTSLQHVPHIVTSWRSCRFVIFIVLVIVGSSNAVNLTDGLDGLAIGCTIIAAGALTVLTYVSGHVRLRRYLELQRMPLVGELTIFCGSHGGREHRLPLVQRASGGGLHGRRGLAGAGRRHRHGGGDHQAGAAAALHRRHLRAGGGLA